MLKLSSYTNIKEANKIGFPYIIIDIIYAIITDVSDYIQGNLNDNDGPP